MDDFSLSRSAIPRPDPTFDPTATFHIWNNYAGSASLEHIDPKGPRERVLQPILRGSRFQGEPRPIDTRAWKQMHMTGLIFVQDPLASLRRPRRTEHP